MLICSGQGSERCSLNGDVSSNDCSYDETSFVKAVQDAVSALQEDKLGTAGYYRRIVTNRSCCNFL